jgi:hypothetical protein
MLAVLIGACVVLRFMAIPNSTFFSAFCFISKIKNSQTNGKINAAHVNIRIICRPKSNFNF